MTTFNETIKGMRAAERKRRVDALREGRKQRAVTFTDRKKENARTVCRSKVMV